MEKNFLDVKCIISDCGFTSVLDEFAHNLHQHHIPPQLILPTATLLSKRRVGYSFKEASTIEQVKKSKTPTLFIHGDQDTFVPTYMVYDLYNACSSDKDFLLLKVPNMLKAILLIRNYVKKQLLNSCLNT